MNVESISSAWRGNLCCEECSTRLTVFRKKKICYFCKNSFCQVCIVRREDKKLCCGKCQILTARPLDRNKLLNLRSRDLINYLSSRQIPTNGCVEKEDLVNVLIKAVNNSCFHPSSTACFENSTNSYPSSTRNACNSAAQRSQAIENIFNDGIRITGHDCAENERSGGQTSHFEVTDFLSQQGSEAIPFPNLSGLRAGRFSQSNVEHGDGVQQTTSETSNILSDLDDGDQQTTSEKSNILSDLDDGDQQTTSEKSNILSGLNDGVQDGRGSSLNRPLMLSDIKSKSDLDALSIKQLKELLMRNRTDFKGCVERAELIQKANRLWIDYTVSRKELENLSLEELCKICMDAPIECVLLECGHMATCTACGKQLCECPICRQFVVRCVRTFKA